MFLDVDECLASSGGCDQQCSNSVGSFECSCTEGFTLDSNGRSCIDIDECQTAGLCSHDCVNTPGSYHCECRNGFNLASDQSACLGKKILYNNEELSKSLSLLLFPADIDECSAANGGCEYNCTNSIGGFQCSCQLGFQLDSNNSTCSDIDECLSNPCQQTCANMPGGFHCSCRPGYTLSPDEFSCTGTLSTYTITLHYFNRLTISFNRCRRMCSEQ